MADAEAASASFAVKMFRSIPLLIAKKKALVDWTPALSLEQKWPASPNKAAMAACLEMLDALNRGDWACVDDCLEWFAWLWTQPFMLSESGTAEDIYLGGVAYSCDVAGCVAAEVGDEVRAEPIRALARSHVGLCLAGLVPWSGRKVVDKNGDGSAQTVLAGTGKLASEMEYVCRPGMRSWVRQGKKVGDPFAFTDNHGPSAIVRAALGLSIAKSCRTERALWAARVKRWKVGRFAPFGLDADQLRAAHEYRRDVTSAPKARAIAGWILAMELDFRFYRYSDGSCLAAMIDTRNSSTDPRMLDACYKGGETRKASPEDGIRSSNRPCRSWWETGGLCTQFVDGSGKVLRIPKPQGEELVYTVVCDFDKPFAYVDAGTAGIPIGVPTTPAESVPKPPGKPAERPTWLDRLKDWLGL